MDLIIDIKNNHFNMLFDVLPGCHCGAARVNSQLCKSPSQGRLSPETVKLTESRRVTKKRGDRWWMLAGVRTFGENLHFCNCGVGVKKAPQGAGRVGYAMQRLDRRR